MPDNYNLCYKLSSPKVIETGDNQGYMFDRMALGDKIRAARETRKWSQQDLACAVGISQPAIKKIESGETVKSKFIPDILRVLQISEDGEPAGEHRPAPEFLGARDLKVFAAVEGGPGFMVVSAEHVDLVPRPWFLQHVKEAYAVLVVGDSMEPVFEPGDMALVNPRLPPMRGKDAIFVATQNGGDWRASIKRFVKSTATEYIVQQFNPPREIRLKKTEWQEAFRVVGKYNGG